MKISNNFSREEFACKCGCGFATVDIELVKVLETVRERFNKPVTINSACRCEHHNRHIGGATKSKHRLGIAADITVADIEPNEVHEFLCDHMPLRYGIGRYKTFTHIDIRSTKARW